MFWVVAHCWATPPLTGREMSRVSVCPVASSRENLHPLADPVAANTHTRETVVLRNVMLALCTSLVTGWRGNDHSEVERERERERLTDSDRLCRATAKADASTDYDRVVGGHEVRGGQVEGQPLASVENSL